MLNRTKCDIMVGAVRYPVTAQSLVHGKMICDSYRYTLTTRERKNAYDN